jgi:periplasmic protein TonB
VSAVETMLSGCRSWIVHAACLLLVVGCAVPPIEDRSTPSTQTQQRPGLEPRFAEYLDAWVAKVERVGNANYPPEARGGIYGSVRLSVSVKADGSIESIHVDRSSGYEQLDRAAIRIVELASPFAPFPPDIRRDANVLTISRTWTFTPAEWFESR